MDTGILEVILGLIAVVFAMLSYSLEIQRSEKERRLQKLREYGEQTPLIVNQFVEVVLLGPRYSGKTSIAELWTIPWTQISKIPSATWHIYEADVFEFESEKHRDPLFQVERVHIPTLRVRVRDYPGEDHYRLQAIKELKELEKKAVVIFVLLVGYHDQKVQHSRENAAYFSRVFVEEINEQLQRIAGSVAKAIVVFNKADLLPPEWDDTTTLERLKEANDGAIQNIERVFSGAFEYHLVSALTNKGIIGLLGSVGKVGVESSKERQRFDQVFQAIVKKD